MQKYTWPVSTGKAGYATPSGNYRAFRMEEDHYSKEWDDAPMPHSMFFTKRATRSTARSRRAARPPASHGCVRLAPANAATLFALVKAEGVTSTKVVITGGDPAPAVAKRRAPQPVEEANGMFRSDPYGERAARDPNSAQIWPDPYGERARAGYAARAQQQQQQYYQQQQNYGYQQRGYPYAGGYYRNGW